MPAASSTREPLCRPKGPTTARMWRRLSKPGIYGTLPMNVNLTPELEKLVQQKVASGLYNNQSEVVREALRLMVEQDRVREAQLDHLRASLTRGLAEADRGELLDGAAVVSELRALLRERSDEAEP